ncbi:hypothetical protein OOK48_35095 [Streptomyces viridodiastaticus]|uniref:hypothetical protein n=1 Tax=Streptomyces albogriseolus TaxID=1887 RepID=UPI002259F5C4|nr:hypothetical protein [Streptomyces viridodiastaticus]MCX4571549.1 hypothetical protein [Streptomyces viridodiastaticus]
MPKATNPALAAEKGNAMDRYEIRSIEGDPASGDVDFHRGPLETVFYVHDTVKEKPVPFSTTHDEAAAQRDCARRNSRS